MWDGAIRRSLIITALPIAGWLFSVTTASIYSPITASWLSNQSEGMGVIMALPLIIVVAIGAISITAGPLIFAAGFILLVAALVKKYK